MPDRLISVIGSAGRKPFSHLVTEETYDLMFNKLIDLILFDKFINIELPVMVGGGAAFSDHLTIRLFNERPDLCKNLILHMPARWSKSKGMYSETTRDGQISNYYHREFSKKCGIDSLAEINLAIANGAIINDTWKGFFDRNNKVGCSNLLIAFTWSSTGSPADGGTAHTWNNSKCSDKIHIDIGSLK